MELKVGQAAQNPNGAWRCEDTTKHLTTASLNTKTTMAISENTSQQSVNTHSHAPKDPPSQQTFEPRHLTVGECAVNDHWEPGEPNSRPTRAPYLRLAGKWLEQAGFTPGAKVRVDVSQGRLVIEPVADFPERTPHLPRRGKEVFP